MAQLKRCPFCKGTHRKKSAVLKCKRKTKGPETWKV